MSKAALITGAARGIGAKIALRLAKDGYDIVINCINQEQADTDGAALAAQCEAFGVRTVCIIANVADFDESERLVKETVEKLGSLDVIVNNAGITNDKLMVRMKEADFDSVINVNLKGTFHIMRHGAAVMMKQRRGKIINISSVAGVYGNAGQANYSASKAGVIGLTKTAAKELGGRGITVNAVAPGFIETPMTENLPDSVKEAALAGIALKRFGQPEEIANVVAFLASDDASYVTGQVIEISGGMTL